MTGFLVTNSNGVMFSELGDFFSEVKVPFFGLSYLSFKTCSFSASDDDDDEGEE